MWIIELALKRPYTIAVGVILTFILGIISINKMLVDIFPIIDIPVVNIIWNYPGLTPNEVEKSCFSCRKSLYNFSKWHLKIRIHFHSRLRNSKNIF